MKKSATIIVSLMLILLAPLSAEIITFRGGESSLSMRAGQEEVTLSNGAAVNVGSLSISSDKIVLSGTDWRYVECTGKTVLTDDERGLEITTSHLWYDREDNRLLLSPWFELEDKKEELNATGGSLSYDMNSETLELSMLISIIKTSSRGLMRCRAERVIFSRNSQTLVLSGGASVSWDADQYQAEVISVDLNNDAISLDGRIKGNING